MLLHCKDRTVFCFTKYIRQKLCLFLQIFLPVNNFSSPIKDLMESTLGWDSKAFGTVFSLIFAGIILDKMGVRFTAVLSGAVMLTGMTPQEWKNKV